MSGWQPIETAQLGIEALFACAEDVTGEAWVKLGSLIRDDPHCILTDDQMHYWPHENGGWITHWMPIPRLPVSA